MSSFNVLDSFVFLGVLLDFIFNSNDPFWANSIIAFSHPSTVS